MKKIAIAILAALSSAAIAAENPPTKTAPTMKIGECLQVYGALTQLDRYDKLIKDGDRERVVSVPYKLGSARLQIARAITALRPVFEDVDKARLGLIEEIGGGKPIEANSPELNKLNAEYQKILAKPCEAVVPMISIKSLNVGDDENPISPTILSVLAPVLD